ncbi:hypothetical protein BDV93DRAFT_510783 [Ceratobasidium sp. AG-I]|nr:hypothetical protein BDV93DRAFT_510783 [Ceratobasidium sp. AG-I]
MHGFSLEMHYLGLIMCSVVLTNLEVATCDLFDEARFPLESGVFLLRSKVERQRIKVSQELFALVVIGGTYGVDDWYPHPRPETIDDIIRRALALSPLIAPPESRENGRTPTVEDVRSIIIESGCGLRPARKGGIRLETGSVEYMLDGKGHATPLVFNYGEIGANESRPKISHGGQGYQSSWGTAEKAVEIVEQIPTIKLMEYLRCGPFNVMGVKW